MNEFNTDSKALRDTLKALKPFVDPKPHIPILGYVKLESENGMLSITAINGDRFGTEPSHTTFKVKTPSCPSFQIAVRFDDLNKIVAKLKEKVMLCAEDQKLLINSKRLSFTINGRDPSDFPSSTNERGTLIASTMLDFRDLQKDLLFVMKATEKSDKQHFTNGVLFDYCVPERLRLVGTDGRRLHSTFPQGRCHTCASDRHQWIIPVRWIEAFTRLEMRRDVTYADVYFDFHEGDMMYWRIPSHDMYGMVECMDTPYPDYEKVIPDERISTFRLDKKPMLESLDAILPVATQDDGRDMVVVHANGTINLSARSESFGTASAEVPCTHVCGPETRFALNIQYLIETIKLSDKTVLMSNSAELEPVVFEYPGTEKLAVLMPVRLPE